MAFLPPPPNQVAKVDSGEYREWWYRLWRFVLDLYDLVLSIQVTVNNISAGGFVPYFIAAGETFTVPLYKQALFEMTIDCNGILDIEGFLIQVT